MKSCIHIGIADWCEIATEHGKKYNKCIGIEAIPSSYRNACDRAKNWNEKYNTDFKVFNYLVTNQDNKEYQFNISNNGGHSSSIYPMKLHKEIWKEVKEIRTEKMLSTRMTTIVENNNINLLDYQILIIDTQGSELEVLKSFDGKIKHFEMIEVEISLIELYDGQVLFEELNQYLESMDFTTKSYPNCFHTNLQYTKI